jgi:hypothetical protein
VSRRTETAWIPEIFRKKRRLFTKSVAERRTPVPLAQMNLTLLDSIRPSDSYESLEEALEISAIAAADFRKQIAIIHETLRPDGHPTSFGGISRLLGSVKATFASHYYRYLEEQKHGP